MKINQLSQETLQEIAGMLKALADPTRLKIMQTLHKGEASVSEIVHKVGTGQANISKHLQVLSKHHLLKSRREGVTIYYQLFGPFISELCENICKTYAQSISEKYGVRHPLKRRTQ